MALVGKYVLLEYDVGGPRLWHERMVLEWVRDEEYVVVTPTRDIFVEQLSILNEDLRSIRVRSRRGAVPGGVNAAEIFALPAWNPGDLAAIRAEALRVAQTERAQVAAAPAAPVVPAVGVGGAVAAVVHGGGQLKWLAAEASAGYAYGQEVPGVTAALAKGSKHVHVTAGNESIFVECVDGADLETFRNRPSKCDCRVLEVMKNGLGTPEAPLKEAISRCKEAEVSWVLAGPRTANWCLQYLLVEGLGLEGHHERFRLGRATCL